MTWSQDCRTLGGLRHKMINVLLPMFLKHFASTLKSTRRILQNYWWKAQPQFSGWMMHQSSVNFGVQNWCFSTNLQVDWLGLPGLTLGKLHFIYTNNPRDRGVLSFWLKTRGEKHRVFGHLQSNWPYREVKNRFGVSTYPAKTKTVIKKTNLEIAILPLFFFTQSF